MIIFISFVSVVVIVLGAFVVVAILKLFILFTLPAPVAHHDGLDLFIICLNIVFNVLFDLKSLSLIVLFFICLIILSMPYASSHCSLRLSRNSVSFVTVYFPSAPAVINLSRAAFNVSAAVLY